MPGADVEGSLPFDEVYRLHAPSVYRFCLSQLRNPTVAEDVTADVFVAALAAYERVQPDPAGLHAWLFRIAKNTVLNRHRGAARLAKALTSLGRQSSEAADVETRAGVREDLRTALDLVQTLGARDRLLIGLRCAAELSFAEMSVILELPEKTVAMATYRAIDRLKSKKH